MANDNQSSDLEHHPPNDAALVDMLGVKIRLSRWGVGAITVLVALMTGLVLLWMSPEQAVVLITALCGR